MYQMDDTYNECNYVSDGWHIQWNMNATMYQMDGTYNECHYVSDGWHIICSNFGSIQPESKVAVWSTSAKPAMPGSHAGSIDQESWIEAGHAGIEDEAANMSQKELLALSPAHFIDIATGEPIPNSRCLYICRELERIYILFQEGRQKNKQTDW